MSSRQIDLLFQGATPGLRRRVVRAFVKRLEKEVASGHGFSCLIADDAELQRLNREFRKHDHPTDVLSFPDATESGTENGFLGEIAISFETAQRQATEYGHGVEQEIEILMLHGVLHLLGMDHEADSGEMCDAERNWRAKLGLPPGLIERVHA
jgi:probable rRNA maturation factor